jgi:hypothetical protein
MDVMTMIKTAADLGFTIAAAIGGGVFIGILLKYILAGVVEDVESLNGLATMLNNRVRTMNNDLIRIDALVSSRFGLRVDLERLARTDGKTDARRD